MPSILNLLSVLLSGRGASNGGSRGVLVPSGSDSAFLPHVNFPGSMLRWLMKDLCLLRVLKEEGSPGPQILAAHTKHPSEVLSNC